MTSASAPSEKSATRPPIAQPEGIRLREEYRVGEVLGAGNFGITYRARDEHLNTDVAIKEYYPHRMAGLGDEDQRIEPHSEQDREDFRYGLGQFMQERRRIYRSERVSDQPGSE